MTRLQGPATFLAVSICLLSLVGGIAFYKQQYRPVVLKPDDIYLFDGINGPQGTSVVPSPVPASPSAYRSGASNSLAVLLTEPSSNWLGVAHGLKTIGVPFVVTRDYQEALTHRVILVYPTLTGKTLRPEALRALGAVPRQGGTLIATDVLGGGLEEVFGFTKAVASRNRFEVRWEMRHPLLLSFTDPAEQITRLGDREQQREAIGSYGYLNARGALARYADGSAAVTIKSYEQGRAVAIGLDIGALLLKGYNNRADGMTVSFNNRFDPTLDVWLRLLRSLYVSGEPNAVTIGTVPFGKSLSVMFTHDVDFTRSMANAVAYAEYEKSRGLVGTYFVQTKYVKDFNDDIFFNQEGVKHVKRLADLGMELASHTVAHSRVFNTFPLGTGEERYPSYVPFVKDRVTAENATVLGELRVSKFLIEHFGGQVPILSFRPGELSNPYALPQALVATGFRYSSTATANNSLTHFPYQLTYDRLAESEVPIFEFPITVEDEELPPMGERLPQAVTVAKQIARYGGSMVVLIHPNILGHKLEFEQDFYDAVKEWAWFGSVKQFGEWWAARNALALAVKQDGTFCEVAVTVPQPIDGLTVEVPEHWVLVPNSSASDAVTQTGRLVVLSHVANETTVRFSCPVSNGAAVREARLHASENKVETLAPAY